MGIKKFIGNMLQKPMHIFQNVLPQNKFTFLFQFSANFLKYLCAKDPFILYQALFPFLGQKYVKTQRKEVAHRAKVF